MRDDASASRERHRVQSGRGGSRRVVAPLGRCSYRSLSRPLRVARAAERKAPLCRVRRAERRHHAPLPPGADVTCAAAYSAAAHLGANVSQTIYRSESTAPDRGAQPTTRPHLRTPRITSLPHSPTTWKHTAREPLISTPRAGLK